MRRIHATFGKFQLLVERKSGDEERSIPATAADSGQKVGLLEFQSGYLSFISPRLVNSTVSVLTAVQHLISLLS